MTHRCTKRALSAFLLFAFAMVGTVHGYAQSKELTEALKITSTNDDDDTVNTVVCSKVCNNGFGGLVYADLGGSTMLNKIGTKTSGATGLSWAIGGQVAYTMQAGKKSKAVISAGLELRNYNATASSVDRFGGTAYDNLHYWYVGVPVQLQIMSVKSKPNANVTTGYYAQAGFTTGYTARVNDVYSMQGVTTKYDTTGHYKKYMLQPYLSAGFTCTTPRATYMIGPYVGYTINNLIPNDAVNQHILSYGIKLTTAFF